MGLGESKQRTWNGDYREPKYEPSDDQIQSALQSVSGATNNPRSRLPASVDPSHAPPPGMNRHGQNPLGKRKTRKSNSKSRKSHNTRKVRKTNNKSRKTRK